MIFTRTLFFTLLMLVSLSSFAQTSADTSEKLKEYEGAPKLIPRGEAEGRGVALGMEDCPSGTCSIHVTNRYNGRTEDTNPKEQFKNPTNQKKDGTQ